LRGATRHVIQAIPARPATSPTVWANGTGTSVALSGIPPTRISHSTALPTNVGSESSERSDTGTDRLPTQPQPSPVSVVIATNVAPRTEPYASP
jgi:hypothetical protein